MKQQNTVLDIGSLKVVCLCGSVVGKDGVVVYGAGIKEHPGFRSGAFLDRRKTIAAIRAAVEAAEQESRTRIRELSVAVPSSFARMVLVDAQTEVVSRSKRISDAEIDMLINASMEHDVPEGCALIHSTPVRFSIGDKQYGDVPIGQNADSISGTISHMYVMQSFMDVVNEALQDMDIRVNMCISTALAEALFLVPAKDRIRPTLVVDIGYYQTDLSVIENAALVAMETFEVGGMHLANDVSIGLEIPLTIAEQLKRRHVFALDYQDSEETVRTAQGNKRILHSDVQYIIEARAREMADMIREQMGKWDLNLRAHPVIYLTGGGMTLMRGAQEFLEKALGVRVKRDMPWMPRLSSANYASTYGVLDFALHADDEEQVGRMRGAQEQSPMLKRLIGLFK